MAGMPTNPAGIVYVKFQNSKSLLRLAPIYWLCHRNKTTHLMTLYAPPYAPAYPTEYVAFTFPDTVTEMPSRSSQDFTSFGDVNGYGFGATINEKMDFEVPRGYVRFKV
jgi:hypothetical protein